MKNKTKGFAALELVYEGEATQVFYAFPRQSSEERDSSKAILAKENVFPFLTREQEDNVTKLLDSEESEVEPVSVELNEENYPLLVSLVAENALIKLSASGEVIERQESLDNKEITESDTFCDGSDRKETLQHARKAFRTIDELSDAITQIKESISGNVSKEVSEKKIAKETKKLNKKIIRLSEKILNESNRDLKDLGAKELEALSKELYSQIFTSESEENEPLTEAQKLEIITKIHEYETTLGNELTGKEQLESLDDAALVALRENLNNTIQSQVSGTSEEDNKDQETNKKDETQEQEDTPLEQVEDPTLGEAHVQNTDEQQDDEDDSHVLDPKLLEQLRLYRTPTKSGNARRSRN